MPGDARGTNTAGEPRSSEAESEASELAGLACSTCNYTKPYEFIGFGAMAVTKPYKCIGFYRV